MASRCDAVTMPTLACWRVNIEAAIVSLEGTMGGQEFTELCPGTNKQLALAARDLGQVIPCRLRTCNSSDRSGLLLLHTLQRGLQLLPFKVVEPGQQTIQFGLFSRRQHTSLFTGAKSIEPLLLGLVPGWVTHRHCPCAHKYLNISFFIVLPRRFKGAKQEKMKLLLVRYIPSSF